jgi:WD40 repeat protein
MSARPTRRIALPLLLLGALALTPAATPLAAQYFGRNKVQYAAFKFDVLKTEHFDIYFYSTETEVAEHVGRIAERWYNRFSVIMNHKLHGRQALILYASHPDFEQTNAIAGTLGEGTGGVTEVLKRRIVLPVGSSLAETDHVVGHELVHAFQYDMTGEGLGMNFRVPSAVRLPLWFIEGMAEYLSIGPVDPNTAMWLRDAIAQHKMPTISQMNDPRYFPYRYGQAFWAFIAGRYGDAMVGEALRRAGRAGSPDAALQSITGLRIDSLSKVWHQDIASAYEPLRKVTDPPTAYGRLVVGGTTHPGLNVAPALSPNGNRMVFFSQRDLFSVDLFLADPKTGKVMRRLTQTALDPHYQSLEFINSAGAFDYSGRHIALGAVANGRAVLTVLDADEQRVEREIKLPKNIGEVFNPTWSPSSRYVAFSALADGSTDLFVYDLTNKSLDRLTDDPYADFEPAWSPDGTTIAFVSDRFSTHLDRLAYGDYELALMDVRTRAIRRLPAFTDAKNINPQWSPDGSSLYFVSDRNGISNIYRIDVGTGQLHQVTNLYTGASGITSLSPAIAVAQRSGQIVYGVYEASGYSLYSLDSSHAAGTAVAAPLAAVSPAVLPPQDRISAELLTALHDPDAGLPGPDAGQTVKAYSASLSLDYVSQPSLMVGADRFGTYVGGGIALLWSDMLGNHNLVTSAVINGGFKDASALVAYENDTHRWNWGVTGQQVPYYSGGYTYGTGTVLGEPAVLQSVELYRQTNRQLTLMTSYPFNAATRVEFSAGVNNVDFDYQIETQAISQINGVLLYDSTYHIATYPGITLGTAMAAFVYDNSYFGATSPLLGQRARFEVSPAMGTISWVNVLADYRRYMIPFRPFTLAARAFYYGRHGSGADDPRLAPIYIGYPSLVRGYDIGSFNAIECQASGTTSCPAFDRLLGSRVAVGNLELRWPLFGLLHLGSGYYGAFPIETAIFADGGVAYCDHTNPLFCTGDNHPVYSTGAAMRINLLGYAIFEMDYVKPFQRDIKGWYWEFSLTPGF